MDVLVVGAGKSGTTALLYSIARALGGAARITFEPTAPEQIDFAPAAHCLCKIVLGVAPISRFVPVFPRFDRRLFIVRDPRDMLVSRMLYKVRDLQFIHDASRLQRLLTALERKEAEPEALGVLDLLRLIGELEGLPNYMEDTVAHVLLPVQVWPQLQAAFHLVRYEDFVGGKTGRLAAYLGFAVSSAVDVPAWVQRVVRTKSSGDWKNWFTADDVDSLRERLSPCLECFNYPNEWELPDGRRVDPQHASRYVAWIVDLKRSGRG